MAHSSKLQNLLRHVEDGHDFAAQFLGVGEALAEQNHFGDQVVVGFAHGDGAEELLQVVWQLRAPAVPFAGRVQGHEDARVGINIDL